MSWFTLYVISILFSESIFILFILFHFCLCKLIVRHNLRWYLGVYLGILQWGCWNIEGADEKINSVKISKVDQHFFKNTLKMFDILCLQETHLSEEDIPEMDGYDATPHCRKISGNNRYFGV